MSSKDFSSGKLVLLMGPSGVGKSVVLHRLRALYPSLVFPRSATTRARRPGEGDDLYIFMTDAAFDDCMARGKLLEWARVHGGARYGTLLDEIIPRIEEGCIVMREVDVQGFETLRRHPLFHGQDPRYVLQSIFLLPESTEQLVAHITRRAPMGQSELERRLRSMEREMRFADICDARVVSREGKLADVVQEIAHIIRLPRAPS